MNRRTPLVRHWPRGHVNVDPCVDECPDGSTNRGTGPGNKICLCTRKSVSAFLTATLHLLILKRVGPDRENYKKDMFPCTSCSESRSPAERGDAILLGSRYSDDHKGSQHPSKY